MTIENHRNDESEISLYDKIMEDKMWGEIRRLAKTNPALKDAVDKVITVYHLVKDR